MNLKVLLPFKVFIEKTRVLRMVVETSAGSLGILPQRLDCVAALKAGILVFESEADGEQYIAVDEGVFVKTGRDVLVSVRNAIAGTDLHLLRAAVAQEFLDLDVQERDAKVVLAKLESGFIHRFKETRSG
jgi:F-type H+-transporting ATPase subunit epsilon